MISLNTLDEYQELVYFEGKETLRKSRNISIAELEREIGRIYDLLFKK